MDRRILLKSIVIVGIMLVIGGGAMYYFLPIKGEQPVVSTTQKLPSQTVKTYTDGSGFTFNYPEDVVLTKQDINDSITYSNLELTSAKSPGKISVKIQDSDVASIDQWLAKNTKASVSATAKEVKLGDLSAREIQVGDAFVTAALDKGILFTIKVDPQKEKDYWVSVYNAILPSFSFVSPSAAPVASSDQSSDDVVLEEETTQ